MEISLATYEDATTKFWRMPELVEKLLEYLDEVSILSIVGVKMQVVPKSRLFLSYTFHFNNLMGLRRREEGNNFNSENDSIKKGIISLLPLTNC